MTSMPSAATRPITPPKPGWSAWWLTAGGGESVIGVYGSLVVESGQHLVREVDVGVDVLHVVAVLQRVDELEHLAGAVEVDGNADRRLKTGLGRVVVDARVLQRGAHPDEIARLGDDFEAVAQVVHVLGTGIQDRGQHVVLGQAV